MPSAQFAYNYTINVLSKCSNIISHRSSVFEGRHNDHRSSKVGTSIIHLRRSTHLPSILEGRHIDRRSSKSTHRSSKVNTSIIDLRRSKAETSHRQPNIALTFRQFVTEYCPQRCSIVTYQDSAGYESRARKALNIFLRAAPSALRWLTPTTDSFGATARARGRLWPTLLPHDGLKYQRERGELHSKPLNSL